MPILKMSDLIFEYLGFGTLKSKNFNNSGDKGV